MYLAAAGIGTIGVIDDDVVDLSNLQRQVIHATSRIGMPKVESAVATVREINPEVTLAPHAERLGAGNVMRLIADYDLIADGSDNFETRFLLNDACHLAGKTLVSAAILRFEGQLSTFKSHLGHDYPCYRCLYRDPPPPGMVPSCSEGGVLGALAGTMGALQATEMLKETMGIGDSLAGHLLLYDALGATFRKIRLPRDAGCPLCGDRPSITDLSAHEAATAPA
jgi:adenylyltransferase/sulfurtransferase